MCARFGAHMYMYACMSVCLYIYICARFLTVQFSAFLSPDSDLIKFVTWNMIHGLHVSHVHRQELMSLRGWRIPERNTTCFSVILYNIMLAAWLDLMMVVLFMMLLTRVPPIHNDAKN